MRAESAEVKGGRVLVAAHTCPCTLQPPRIVEVEQDNKMTPGNLGIVFGPLLGSKGYPSRLERRAESIHSLRDEA